MWVAIQRKSIDSLNFPSHNPTEYPYDPTEGYTNFDREAVILYKNHGMRKRKVRLGLIEPDIFERNWSNERLAYSKVFRVKLPESSGYILQIAYRIPKRDKEEGRYFSKEFKPEPERGVIIRYFDIDGMKCDSSGRFMPSSTITIKGLEKWNERKIKGIFSENG